MSPNSGRRILIVDDEPDLLEEVASYFRRKGETVVTATCRDDGLQRLNDELHPIDILISDARLPDGNGIELIRHQIARLGDRSICVLMTGHLDQSQIASDLDRVRVFFKPFSMSQLYRDLQGMIAEAATREATSRQIPVSGATSTALQ